MSEDLPRIFSIPAGASFVDALAQGLLGQWAEETGRPDLGLLSEATVLLPTRRACRALREAFLRVSRGRPLILPSLQPLGDVDLDEPFLLGDFEVLGLASGDDPTPAISPLKRQLLLTALVLRWAELQSEAGRVGTIGEDRAARLAQELALLLDQVQTEGLGFDGLEDLVPEAYAAHWQQTLAFLSILTREWPKILSSHGCVDPAERRNLMLRLQAELWRRLPPGAPIVAAGSTGSIPASADLIATVAGLPRGMVVLPGLDRAAGEAEWRAISRDPSHAQYGLAQLLDKLGVSREQVRDWPGEAPTASRALRSKVIARALQPAALPFDWPGELGASDRASLEAALDPLVRIDCASPSEEAAVVALIMRRGLDQPGQRIALVTPDRRLARRVAGELERWDLSVDDSAGVPLGDTPPGTFLRLTAELVAQRLAPVALLAALKHPLAAGGLEPGAFRRRVRALELAVLRGPRPAPGFDGLRQALQAGRAAPGLLAWLDRIEAMARPFQDALGRPGARLKSVVLGHLAFAEALAASSELDGPARLWAHEAGEVAAGFAADLIDAAALELSLQGEHYPAFLSRTMAAAVVRPRFGSHPRLTILGPLEARLQHSDIVILSGLNEGTWPAEIDPGPWLSRPMRADFGLPAAERRLGLAAHDFSQAAAAPQVFLTRASRVEGTPTVPSRWLLRLDALLRSLGLEGCSSRGSDLWRSWAASLDRSARAEPPRAPSPRPPVSARPRRLSVTEVETWMRDPYALYARKILRLKALEPIDSDPGAAERGILIHRALERFVVAYPGDLPDDPEAALLEIGAEVFAPLRATPAVWAFWWPRFKRIAHWVARIEGAHRRQLVRAWSEVSGTLTIEAEVAPFRLTAKADRIDQQADGTLVLIDYKTGSLPSSGDVGRGAAPQLPLEAVIAATGGFAGVPSAPTARLHYWRLTGGEPAGEVRPLRDPEGLAERAYEGLCHLIELFDDAATAYQSLPRRDWAPAYNDYLHLARAKEWDLGGGGGGP